MLQASHKVSAQFFAELFPNSKEIPDSVLETLQNIDSAYQLPTEEETQEYILNYLKLLNNPYIERDEKQNQLAWEKGWQENLDLIEKNGFDEKYLIPKYFRGSKFLRLKKSIVVSTNSQIEHDLFIAARKLLFYKYLSSSENIYELGCGSCQNLWLLSSLFPKKQIKGFDWVKPCAEIANAIGRHTGRNVSGDLLNMLNPPSNSPIKEGSAIVTIHALEQIGNNHENLINLIIKSNPSIVLNYEPIVEFYDENNLYDYLAIWYSKKRRYLNGYFTALRSLEKENKIEIIDAYRPQLGGVFHEASVIAWRPL